MLKVTLLVLALGVALVWPASNALATDLFSSGADFVARCDGASPSEDCTSAVMHVELVVNDRDHPNATCEGGTDGLVKARDNAELQRWLSQRVVAVVGWLKLHHEYDRLSYGDAIWAGLKGVYCR